MNPIVRRLFDDLWPDGVSVRVLAGISGVDHATIIQWRTKRRSPKMDNVEAVLNAMGWRLCVEPIKPSGEIWFQRYRRPSRARASI